MSPNKVPKAVLTAMKRRRGYAGGEVEKLFTDEGLDGRKLEWRKRKNPAPCTNCDGERYVYRYHGGNEYDDGRWYCLCGYAETPE